VSHTVAVIVPTYNNLDSLKRCLSSLGTQTVSDFKVYICVDGSTDNTFEYLESALFPFPSQVLFHSGKINKGRQATRNLALKISDEPFLLFLDSDLEVNKDWIENHLLQLKTNPITIGKIQFTNSENPWVDYYNSRGYNALNKRLLIKSRYYISTNAGFRKEVFIALGLMDETITVYGGDAEFALRLQRFGFPFIVYNPEAKAFGVESKTIRYAVHQYEQFSEKVLVELMRRYPKQQDYFNYKKLTKFKFIKYNNLDYFIDILENENPGILTRFGIRILLTLALLKGIK
jgi:glycosyltransferase involved in cell wall biosynthesis